MPHIRAKSKRGQAKNSKTSWHSTKFITLCTHIVVGTYVADVLSIDFGLQHYGSIRRDGDLRLIFIPGLTVQMLRRKEA